MISIGANGQKIAYGIKHYNLDTQEDLEKLPTISEKMGCTCFVISTSKYYMLNSDYEWVEITPFGKGFPTSDDDDDDSSSSDIIYEGGII